MATYTISARGTADPATAWERYAVPARWSDWSPQIRGVQASSDRIATGTTGVVTGPAGLRVGFVIEHVDEAARSWEWTVRLGLLRVRMRHDVLADCHGSMTTLRMNGPLPVLLAYSPLAQLALTRLLRG